ncbi:unnamed protein product [Adineta ricciae]|uniref:Apple domain-containing protein n=1 Tax=Adineta ricciae TaxID=249248 RepID=A0A815LT16_ADIRI|nr:unnamed protein product [Adineta ricciae]CAF1410914.1 unnamed protein product [Adineta ricciae]
MLKVIALLLFVSLINEYLSQDIQSVTLRQFIHLQYRCNEIDCLPSLIYHVESLQGCRMICLNQKQCQVATFDPAINQCEIFFEISIKHGEMMEKSNVYSIFAIDNNDILTPVTTATTWTSNVNTPVLSNSISSTVTTQETTSGV